MSECEKCQLEVLAQSVDQTVELGEAISQIVKLGDVICLSGELGAGKTQFVRGLAAGVGADTRLVSSPTFVLMCEYEGRIPLIHIDAYRIQGLSDLESVGWTSELFDCSVTVIEWADRICDYLPEDYLQITFEHKSESSRLIRLEGHGSWADRMDEVSRCVRQFDLAT